MRIQIGLNVGLNTAFPESGESFPTRARNETMLRIARSAPTSPASGRGDTQTTGD